MKGAADGNGFEPGLGMLDGEMREECVLLLHSAGRKHRRVFVEGLTGVQKGARRDRGFVFVVVRTFPRIHGRSVRMRHAGRDDVVRWTFPTADLQYSDAGPSRIMVVDERIPIRSDAAEPVVGASQRSLGRCERVEVRWPLRSRPCDSVTPRTRR